jgi:N-acetylmuramoyl-L-alanine amidase
MMRLPETFRTRRALLAAITALVLVPAAGHANFLTDIFKGPAKAGKAEKHAAAPKHAAHTRHVTPARRHSDESETPAPLPPMTNCDPAKFRILVDVGHTASSEGATSARNVAEFAFNLKLARRIEEQLKADGFAATKLLVTEGKARPSLVRRVNYANKWPADLFLSIHHDSVPNKLLENWEYEGKKSHYSDRFSGYSVWVSHRNPDFKTSLAFAELVAKEMKAKGLDYATQYTLPIMGHYQHPLLNKDTGVYGFDELIVLRTTRMPAVLLEAGSIINRDEELKMNSPERRDLTAAAVAAAAKQFCEARQPKPDKTSAK